jgi:NAD(P)-dependent dehydrogenase (short-subunit alcohol dehydrogenase family)
MRISSAVSLLLVTLLPSLASAWLFPTTQIKTVGTAALIGGAAAGALWKAFNKDPEPPFTPAVGSLKGKNIIITGATSGLGLESARRLAYAGANIILTARSDSKGQSAINEVFNYLKTEGITYEDQSLTYKLLDLDTLASVKEAAGWDLPKIDVLLNNAGIMAPPKREVTVDGFEKQMQSNHLGHFVLTSLLSPNLSEKAFVINVSSMAHVIASQGLLFDYMWKAEQGYGAWKSYGQSKLANVYFTRELQSRSDAAGLNWTVATLHPGVVMTDLSRYIVGEDAFIKLKEGTAGLLQTLSTKVMAAFLKTPAQGATTQIWLASGADGEDCRGKYYTDRKARSLGDFANDAAAGERLWEESERLSGVKFELGASNASLVVVE